MPDEQISPRHGVSENILVLESLLIESIRLHSPRLAAFIVTPAEAGVQERILDSGSSPE